MIIDLFSRSAKIIKNYMPRRRFSECIVSALIEVFDELKSSQPIKEEAGVGEKNPVSTEDFAQLSREEQLKVLEETSWIKNIDFNPSVAELHSLTGGKKAKWKFEVKFNEKYLDT